MTEAPPISLVIPLYNREHYISAAIGSVRNQSRTDFELIVWDDGSTDDSLAAARAAAGDDPRVRIVAGPHAGIVASVNAAAAQCRGQYFGWIDSDDAIAQHALRETAAVLDARPEIGFVYSGYVTMDETGRVRGVGKRTNVPYSRDRLLVDFMTFQFRLIRKQLFDQLGGLEPQAEKAEDYDLCLRLSEITQPAFVDQPLYFYRIHADSISHRSRIDQILPSKAAIERALARRKLDDQYDLEVEIVGRFQLKKRAGK